MRFHTSLPVRNIRETVDFYRVLFESEPVKVKPDYAKFLPADPDINISFHQSTSAVDSAVDRLRDLHLGFELPDRQSLDRAHRRLAEAGLISTARDTGVCCYANQDKFWVTDPDGYRWELYLLLEDTATRNAPATECCAPSSAADAPSCCS